MHIDVRFFASVLFSALVSCASADLEVAGKSAADPRAPAAPAPTSLGFLAGDFDPERAAPAAAAAADDPHAHHGHGEMQPASGYTCPHHPEVKSDEPGTCPKCKMDLVPVAPAPKSDGPAHEHDHGAH